jgi:hypothetical protein
VDRYASIGTVDPYYLASLSADAAPALAPLPRRPRACATVRVRRALAHDPDGLAGLNRARGRARTALAGLSGCAE